MRWRPRRALGAMVGVQMAAWAVAGPRVVLISVDGLRPDAISPQWAPQMSALRAAGAAPLRAFNDLPSATLPNHTTMLTGLASTTHGVLANVDIPGTVAHPTLFDYARQAGLRSAFFATKSKLGYLARPEACDPIVIGDDPESTVQRLLEEIRPDGPDLLFLHLREPDSTGHQEGWMSPAYLAAVAHMDALVGLIWQAVISEPSRTTCLLVTADHGGEGFNHFVNVPENRLIPWIVVGAGIPPQSTLPEEVFTADTTPTVLWLLGVEPPAGLAGQARRGLMPGLEPEPIVSSGTGAPPVDIPCLVLVLPVLAVALGVSSGLRRAGWPLPTRWRPR